MRTAKKIFGVSSFLIFLLTGSQYAHGQTTPAPVLVTEENSSRAIAFESVTHVRDPWPVVTVNNFNPNVRRTWVALFGINMALNPGENATAVTARARDSRSKIYSLPVDYVGQVPNETSLTQIVFKLADELANAGDVVISVTLHGQTSNEVLFTIRAQTEPRQVTLPVRRVVNGVDNYTDACFSFEFGINGQTALPINRNDWDIEFGNNSSHNQFDVTMVTDDCSRMQDMGAFNWSDNFQVPVLTAYPVPTDDPSVTAVVGHMYVVHTKDSDTNLYALFRVESIDLGNSVTISWMSVRSPE